MVWRGAPSTTDLFEDHSMSVELLCSLSSGRDLGRDGQPQSRELPHLPQQGHQSVAVVDPQLAVSGVKLHQFTSCLQTVQAERDQHCVLQYM